MGHETWGGGLLVNLDELDEDVDDLLRDGVVERHGLGLQVLASVCDELSL